MADTQIEKKIRDLIQVDIDASFVYSQAIDAVDDAEVREKFVKFKEDHDRHIQNLSTALQNMGGTPPDRTRDLTGHILSAMTSLMSLAGMKGVVTALKRSEEITNRNYRDAQGYEVAPDVKNMIQQGFEDEKKQLAYLEEISKKY